jgi:hypothetical protein
MSKEDKKTPGQIGYEAYSAFSGWKSRGESITPEWVDVLSSTKAAWEAAAKAILANDKKVPEYRDWGDK